MNIIRQSGIFKSMPQVIVAVAALASFAFAAYSQAEEVERPNFVLFIGDDISFDDFGSYGHPTLPTPNVDALASGGLRFVNAYLATSSCSPTRTSLISGRYPHNTGAPELHMGASPHLGRLPQFPHELRKAGYYTAQAGKWHFNGDADKSFDDRAGGRPSGAENWVPSLRERPKDKPFFMWFAAFDAHRDWDQSLSEGPQTPENVRVPPYMADTPGTREDLAHYDNEVHRYDANIGRVVEELKRQGEYENTVIIVMADNGRPFPRDKTWLYDSGIKTPLVVHWPANIRKAAVVESLVSVIDLPPTILELAGVDVPEAFQGVSLAPMLEDPAASVRDFVFAERNWHTQRYHERMVRHGNWVYIRNNLPELRGVNFVHLSRSQGGAYSELAERWRAGEASAAQEDIFMKPRPEHTLFNVAEDPYQLENLAGDPGHADKLALLRRALDQWTRKTGDTLPKLGGMTLDRAHRDTWEAKSQSGRPGAGEVPGQATKAWKINHPGPVHTGDLKDAKTAGRQGAR